MRTRLKDVAEHLNLSPALVSGVLNHRPNVWASPETRERINEAAKRLNYQPNATAQALSQGKTRSVALVYRRLSGDDYRLAYTGLVDALSDSLQAFGHSLSVANFASQEETLRYLQRIARSRACDAVVLWGREADTEAQGELLERERMPFMVKGRHEVRHPHWRQVDFDHEGMMRQSLLQVAQLGHQRIAYLGFPHDDEYVHALRRGFEEAHREVIGSQPQFFAEHEDSVEPNEASISQWLRMPEGQRPTAFVIGAGNAAWHALEMCLARIGKRLGEGREDAAASGITSLFFTLMFGSALVYQGIEVDSLARMASPELLRSMVEGRDETPVHRICPCLVPAKSLDLLRKGIAFEANRS